MASDLFAAPTKDELANANLFSPPTGDEIKKASPPGFLEQTARSGVNSLPAIGGIIGGVAGTPADAVVGPMGNVVGAGIGGYLGTAAKNAINNYTGWDKAPQDISGTVSDAAAGGAKQALAQGTGEAVAPYISKAIGLLSQPASETLEDVADQKMIEATGATGKQASEFEPNAGSKLREMGVGGFGSSQAKIAKQVSSKLENTGQTIGDTIAGLNDRGITVDQADVINAMRKRAQVLGEDPSQFGVADSLNRTADRIQALIESKGGNSEIPILHAETTKRGFQQAANYNSSPLDMSLSKESANIYRQAVEDAAIKADPQSAKIFMDAKKQYQLLRPIEEATTKRAMTLQQSPKGGMLDTIATGVGAGLGGAPGAIVGAPIRRMVSDRIAPTLSATAGGAANALGLLPGAVAASAAPTAQIAAGQMQSGLLKPYRTPSGGEK